MTTDIIARGLALASSVKDAWAASRAMNRQIVCDRAGFVGSAANLANGSSNTQVGDAMSVCLMADTSDLTFTWGNFYSSTQASADMVGLSTVTLRAGWFDGTTYYPVFGPNGSRDIVIEPGAIVESKPLYGDWRAKRGYQLITRKTWASAPANFPGSMVWTDSSRDLSEQGTALTDRTLSGGFTANTRINIYAIMPPLAIKGTIARRPCVAILGNSIHDAGSADIDTGRSQRGWIKRGLYLAGIPYVDLGQSGGFISYVTQNPKALGQYMAAAYVAGVSHLFIECATNDWSTPATAATIYANYQIVAAAAARFGIKTVIGTAPPKTNAANNTYNGTETNTFAQRALLNATIKANNGVGFGYYDLAALWQDAVTGNLWRTDVLQATAISLGNGGTGYVSGDLIEVEQGLVVTPSTLSSGVITAVGLRSSQGGGFLAQPSSPLNALDVQATASGTWAATPGVGLTVSVTASAGVTSTPDGLHAHAALHGLALQDFRAKALSLFAL